jgi:hypothetical protein
MRQPYEPYKPAQFFKITRRSRLTLYRIVAFKTLLWWAGNILAGLAPVWLLLIIGVPRLNDTAHKAILNEYQHLLRDGVITFFFLAIIGSIVVDVYLERKNFPNSGFATKVIIVALAIGFLISIMYMAYVLGGDEHNHFGDNKTMTISIGVTSFIFCTVCKFALILNSLTD